MFKKIFMQKERHRPLISYYVGLHRSESRETNGEKIVNIRLRPDQEERINAIVERSAILDTSKFVRIAVDWLLRSDIGEVIKTIVDDEGAYPGYAMPKETTVNSLGRHELRYSSADAFTESFQIIQRRKYERRLALPD